VRYLRTVQRGHEPASRSGCIQVRDAVQEGGGQI